MPTAAHHADPILRLEKNTRLRLTLADERIDSIAQGLCGRAAAPKAPGKLETNKAVSDACSDITGVDSRPTEPVGLAVQNFSVPEPSTGLLLLAVGLIGVGTRKKNTFRAPSKFA